MNTNYGGGGTVRESRFDSDCRVMPVSGRGVAPPSGFDSPAASTLSAQRELRSDDAAWAAFVAKTSGALQ